MQKPKKSKRETKPSLERIRDAFESVAARLTNMDEQPLLEPGTEVGAVVSAALAAAPAVAMYRDAIRKDLPHFNLAQIDDIEPMALALAYAERVFAYSSTAGDGFAELLDEARKLREGLQIAAEALAHRGLFDKDLVNRTVGEGVDIAASLSALAALFSADWSKVASRTAVEKSEIERASEVASELGLALTAQKAADGADGAAQMLARSFALLLGSYEQCRRAVAFVRWSEQDVDSIAPALQKRKRTAKKAPESAPAADEDTAPETASL